MTKPPPPKKSSDGYSPQKAAVLHPEPRWTGWPLGLLILVSLIKLPIIQCVIPRLHDEANIKQT